MSTDPIALLEDRTPLQHAREQALQVKSYADVELPELSVWNYRGCAHHPDEPDPYCDFRACGGAPWKHQRTGATWLYFAKNGILADETGLGKCATLPSTINDPWLTDLRRFAPGLKVAAAVGDLRERRRIYNRRWDVLVIGFPLMLRDEEHLERIGASILVSDDVQPLTHLDTKTWEAFGRLSMRAERVVNLNATPIGLKLHDLYALGTSVGAREVFGSLRQFENRYVRIEVERIVVPAFKKGKRVGTRILKKRVAKGYKNVDEFKERISPFYFRRTIDDADDVRMPKVLPAADVWLDLHPAQRARYTELRKGIVELRAKGKVAYPAAMQRFGYGQRICAGLPALGEPDGPEASVKLDWLEHALTTDWVEEKIIAFVINRGIVTALHARLQAHGIGTALFWGVEGSTEKRLKIRQEQQARFWEDPNCRVAIGTTSMERGMNLQVARIGVNVDSLLNPQRMRQILGRIKRGGSRHSHVLPVNLLVRDTQESRYLDILRQRAALADYVFDEENELYEALGPLELLDLIAG
jgi:SNF2 family DNA or RNA helicase